MSVTYPPEECEHGVPYTSPNGCIECQNPFHGDKKEDTPKE